MKSKAEIIHDMCMTYRHDYGLDRDPSDPPWLAGMTPDERKGLYNTMEKIYDHHIAPIVEHYNTLNNGSSVVLPVDKEHAEAMVKVGMFYLEKQNASKKTI